MSTTTYSGHHLRVHLNDGNVHEMSFIPGTPDYPDHERQIATWHQDGQIASVYLSRSVMKQTLDGKFRELMMAAEPRQFLAYPEVLTYISNQ